MDNRFSREPLIKVGLLTAVPAAELALEGAFLTSTGVPVSEGNYKVTRGNDAVIINAINSAASLEDRHLVLFPVDGAKACFTVHGVTIGIQFHWERKESQTFQGALVLAPAREGLNIINQIPLESYLASVISSEMSASSPGELLRAHAIVSRSWLLSQLSAQHPGEPTTPPGEPATGAQKGQPAGRAGRRSSTSCADSNLRTLQPSNLSTFPGSDDEIIRWYDRESHADFDVCADDHCQRYQGITKAHSAAAFEAVEYTRGQALVFGGEICDARYSKSCGGMTEAYSAAWQDLAIPYLRPVYDGPGEPEGFAFPLTGEAEAERWIRSSPQAFCNVRSAELLERVLPGFDQETRDFYRWQVEYSADQVSDLLSKRLGIDFGRILDLTAAQRGESGRIVRLRVSGDKRSTTIGKELEIRKALSLSHLYS